MGIHHAASRRSLATAASRAVLWLAVLGSGLAPAPAGHRRRPVATRRSADESGGTQFGFSPALTLGKWETMQAKRVRLEVQYTAAPETHEDEGPGELRKAFLRTKRLIQELYPDVIVEEKPRFGRNDDETLFEVRVDGRLVYSKPRERAGIFLSQRVLQREIMRARKVRRPTTTYFLEDASSVLQNDADAPDPHRAVARDAAGVTKLKVADLAE